jgi:hypothetical protein
MVVVMALVALMNLVVVVAVRDVPIAVVPVPPPVTRTTPIPPPSFHMPELAHLPFSTDFVLSDELITSALIYIGTVSFWNEEDKILWALSYFAEGRAATYQHEYMSYKIDHGHCRHKMWKEFEDEFRVEFMPEDERNECVMKTR